MAATRRRAVDVECYECDVNRRVGNMIGEVGCRQTGQGRKPAHGIQEKRVEKWSSQVGMPTSLKLFGKVNGGCIEEL